jgi:hypothetical protein
MFDIITKTFEKSEVHNPTSPFGSVSEFVYASVNILIGIGFSIAIISVVYSGFMFARSSGDPKVSKKAYDTFLFGAVAMALVMGAVALRFIITRQIFGIADPDDPY